MNISVNQILTLGWPHLALWVGAFICLICSVFYSSKGYRLTAGIAVLTFLGGGFGFWQQWQSGSSTALDLVVFDPFGNFLGLIIALIGLTTVIISFAYFRGQEEKIPEAIPLLVFSTVGMVLMVATTHLLNFVLALELMSLCLYAMVGMRRLDPKSSEAAFKYFLLGSVAASFLLLGISFLYGATGTLDAAKMASVIIPPDRSFLFKTGALLALLGFAFKVAAVPFHFWAPDVYDGAPAPITGFMAAGVKVAAFGALIRVTQALVPWSELSLQQIFVGLSLATMIVGNLTALRQRSLKRIMAYSSIAHAGYLLLGMGTLVVGTEFRSAALSPLLFYLVSYGLLTLGVFAILTFISTRGKEIGDLEELNGLSESHPAYAALLSIFLISLAGIPPSVGFFAKYYLFAQAIQVELYLPAAIGILTSAVSLYYYLGPVVRMYFRSSTEEISLPKAGWIFKGWVFLMAALVFYLGIFPGRTLRLTQETAILSPSAAKVSTQTQGE